MIQTHAGVVNPILKDFGGIRLNDELFGKWNPRGHFLISSTKGCAAKQGLILRDRALEPGITFGLGLEEVNDCFGTLEIHFKFCFTPGFLHQNF